MVFGFVQGDKTWGTPWFPQGKWYLFYGCKNWLLDPCTKGQCLAWWLGSKHTKYRFLHRVGLYWWGGRWLNLSCQGYCRYWSASLLWFSLGVVSLGSILALVTSCLIGCLASRMLPKVINRNACTQVLRGALSLDTKRATFTSCVISCGAYLSDFKNCW